jgi:hypothetical protein
MNTAELTANSERELGVGAEFFYDEPVHLVRDDEVHLHDAALKLRPTPVFGREHIDAFAAAFEETVRELF